MLHVWLIPALVVLGVVVWIFYLTMRFKGGTGVRTEGRTVVHKDVEDDNPPPD